LPVLQAPANHVMLHRTPPCWFARTSIQWLLICERHFAVWLATSISLYGFVLVLVCNLRPCVTRLEAFLSMGDKQSVLTRMPGWTLHRTRIDTMHCANLVLAQLVVGNSLWCSVPATIQVYMPPVFCLVCVPGAAWPSPEAPRCLV
jgi:hypothetical protein